MNEAQAWLHAGIIGRPHGLDGSFHVSDPVAELLVEGAEVDVGGQARRITRRAGFDARPILRIDGCDDRDAADALRGQGIRVARETAPELEEDEWYASELEGCSVHDGGAEVGVVRRLLGLPSCEVLEVERAVGGTPLLVPLVSDAVRSVDVGRKRIEIDLRFLGETS